MHRRRKFSMALAVTVSASSAEERDEQQFPEDAVITDVYLHVPAGHQGLVPARFLLNGGTMLPTTGNAYRLDDVGSQPIVENAEIDVAAGQLMGLAAANEDTANEHTVRAIVNGYFKGGC